MEPNDKDQPLAYHDLSSRCADLATLRIEGKTTEADAAAAMRVLDDFNGCMLGLARFSGETPWERHEEDELLHILEGEVEITVLLDGDARIHGVARAGQIVVVPRGRWHRQHARATTTLLFVTGTTGSSTARDPR
jgi:mannose-6-phosphate isomerase-like protein (cupin superfamily)